MLGESQKQLRCDANKLNTASRNSEKSRPPGTISCYPTKPAVIPFSFITILLLQDGRLNFYSCSTHANYLQSYNNPTQIFADDVTEEKGENARLSAFVGAIAVGDLVKSTLGPKGMDKILQSAYVCIEYTCMAEANRGILVQPAKSWSQMTALQS